MVRRGGKENPRDGSSLSLSFFSLFSFSCFLPCSYANCSFINVIKPASMEAASPAMTPFRDLRPTFRLSDAS